MNLGYDKESPKSKFPNTDKIYTVRLYSDLWDVVYLERIHNPELHIKHWMCEIGFASWRFALLVDHIEFQKLFGN